MISMASSQLSGARADRALLLRQDLLLHRPELTTDLRWRNYPRKITVDARRSKVETIGQHRD
jgi:hypothetical protein